jgi:hypothetical protein
MQGPGTILFVLLFILFCVLSQEQDIRASKLNPSYTWICRSPTPSESESIQADPSNDPVGISGGCMPDATCNYTTGKSLWTNVFGYAKSDQYTC